MWAHLNWQGIAVAKWTVARIKPANSWKGVVRTKRVRTTESDPKAARATDLVDQDFGVAEPNALVVADFTYVPLVSGVHVYTAFALADVENTASVWVAWYNNSRLMHRLGRIPPKEFEAAYYAEIGHLELVHTHS